MQKETRALFYHLIDNDRKANQIRAFFSNLQPAWPFSPTAEKFGCSRRLIKSDVLAGQLRTQVSFTRIHEFHKPEIRLVLADYTVWE